MLGWTGPAGGLASPGARRPRRREPYKEAAAWPAACIAVAAASGPVFATLAGRGYGRLISRAGGRRVATPLFIVFITIGGTDILFALDSIPAVFGVTSEPFIVFAVNAFALLGLRALFFPVTGLLGRLVHLAAGPAVILAFIGAKLILHRPAGSATACRMAAAPDS